MDPNTDKRVQILRHHVAISVAPYRSLLIAISGGLDSMVLLDALVTLRNKDSVACINNLPTLRAIHIHHALSRHADEWAAHCVEECRKHNITCTVVHVVVNVTSDGIEAAARNARYSALASELIQDEVLLVAQHQDDQAETLLLALKRGSGPAGLAAMATDAAYLGHRLVRPLLNFSKRELEVYAQACGLRWIKDNSNTDLRFDRNFLRLCILPPLQQRWPQFTKSVARSAQLCAEQEQLLDELLIDTLANIIAPDGSLCLMPLKLMSESKRAALIRRWLARFGVRMPSRAQLVRLWKEVALSRRDAVAQLKLDNQLIRRFRDRLYILPHLLPLINNRVILPWPKKDKYLALPTGLGYVYRRLVNIKSVVPRKPFIATLGKENTLEGLYNDRRAMPITVVRAPLTNEEVSIRFGSVHGLLYIVGRHRGRTLKKIWQELHIPPWWRCSTPLLFYNDQLITALNVFITWEGAVRKRHAQWQLFWLQDSDDVAITAQENID